MGDVTVLVLGVVGVDPAGDAVVLVVGVAGREGGQVKQEQTFERKKAGVRREEKKGSARLGYLELRLRRGLRL